MVEFEKERKIEQETFAIINYFKLFKLAEMFIKEDDKESFRFIGGMNLVRQLMLDSQEGRIDIFGDSINEMFDILKQNIEYISSPTVGKSYFTEEAIKDFAFIKRNFEEAWCHYETYTLDPSTNIFLEFMQSLPEEVSQKINSLNPEPKKQKEKK